MSWGQCTAEADDQLLLFAQQPGFPVLLRLTVYKGPALLGHMRTLTTLGQDSDADHSAKSLDRSGPGITQQYPIYFTAQLLK